MKFIKNVPPRTFKVGLYNEITLRDYGKIELKPNEMVTFITKTGREYDVVRKNWGFYATPSLNGRLQKFNLRAVIVKNRKNQFFIMLVEKGKEYLFKKYIESEKQTIVYWMDNTKNLKNLEKIINS